MAERFHEDAAAFAAMSGQSRGEFGCPKCGCRDFRKRSPDGEHEGYAQVSGEIRTKIRYCRHCGARVIIAESIKG